MDDYKSVPLESVAAVRCQECARLRAVNAKLLEACEEAKALFNLGRDVEGDKRDGIWSEAAKKRAQAEATHSKLEAAIAAALG